jgi:hypothetical protein
MAEYKEINNLDINTISVPERKMIGSRLLGIKYTKIMIEDLPQHKLDIYLFPIGFCFYIVGKQSVLFEINLFKVFSVSTVFGFQKERWYA